MPTTSDGSSVERVIAWLRAYISKRSIGPGDALPREIDIAAAVDVARSSVREALTGLRALGLIDSRRRGGMRLVRDPVLLDLRDWFAPRYESRARLGEALEFRAVIEQGLAELVFTRMPAEEIASLRRLLDGLADDAEPAAILEAEKRFHTLLMKASRNRLATLLSALITPIFDAMSDAPYSGADWRRDHIALVIALERKDHAAFLRAIREHTLPYLRLQGGRRGRAKQPAR